MLLPSIFGEDLFDDWMMDFPFRGSRSTSLMKTDVKETDNSYELDMDMPGFDKGDIKAELKNGYLTISASSHKTMMKRTTMADTSDGNVIPAPAAEASMWAGM